MSLSGALNNAISGLTMTARSAGIVSSNIANALTEGYGRRELLISSDTTTSYGGVRIDGVMRHVDPVILADRRLADAEMGFAQGMTAGASRFEDLMGVPTEAGSLADLVARFESALVLAAGNPASNLRLESVSDSAAALAQRFNAVSLGIQEERMRADDRIEHHIDTLNTTLQNIERINARITVAINAGRDASSLYDERQKAIDRITELVPVRVVPRDANTVAIYTIGGTQLLDGRASTLEFSPTGVITPEMTRANGLLGGITVNGRAVDPGPGGPLAGGLLAAEFALRDDTMVAAQSELDAVARDLIDRFGPGGADPTLAAGDPGLFTDAGSAFATVDEIGISGRIALNVAVAMDTGDVWRLRDGLAALAPGDAGDATLLNGQLASLKASVSASSATIAGPNRSFSGQVAFLASSAAYDRVQADHGLAFASSQHEALRELELAGGVDTDFELQALLRIEQLYQANTRVVLAVDDMMQNILRI